MAKAKKALPLLKILQDLPDDHRQIVIDHLDEKTCESVIDCIKRVVKSGKKLKSNQELREFILKNQHQIQRLLTNKGGSFTRRRRSLAQFGGGPLALVMSFAVPLIVDHIIRQVESHQRRPKKHLTDVSDPPKPRPLL